jgi:RNA polymerase sigma-70 factor (ECF subfamily)
MHAVTAQPTGSAAFAALTGGYRTELLIHCYRMLGSLQEAEDLVQETYLRAWRAFDTFEGRSSVRTYLYRIATNACLSALQQRSRRIMPSSRGVDDHDPRWLEPIPDAVLGGDPAGAVEARAGIRLAFIAALQHLSPIRRAVLILRDVLALSATETADILNTTIASVNSALPRARAQIARVSPVPDTISEPTDRQCRTLLDRYVTAFEHADIATLAGLMRADIALEMPPLTVWYHGRTSVLRFFADQVLREPGRFRMTLTAANGQPALLARIRHSDGGWHPHAVHIPTVTDDGIIHLAVFLDPPTCQHFAATLGQATGEELDLPVDRRSGTAGPAPVELTPIT